MDAATRVAAFAALERAEFAAGGKSALARICGCTPGNISQLIAKRSPLSARFVLKVEEALGISRHELRPDIYPPESHVVGSTPLPAVVAAGGAAPHRNRAHVFQPLGEPVR